MHHSVVQERPPNALALSCAAPLDRERTRLVPDSEKGPILLDAKRRQLQRLVGPQGFLALSSRSF